MISPARSLPKSETSDIDVWLLVPVFNVTSTRPESCSTDRTLQKNNWNKINCCYQVNKLIRKLK